MLISLLLLFNLQIPFNMYGNLTENFCPENISFSEIWMKNSLNECFFDTVSSSIIAGYILVFGVLQIIVYRKYATRIDAHRIRSSFFYSFQIFLLVLLPMLCAIRLILRWKYYEPPQVYGYTVCSHDLKLLFYD